MLEKRGTFLSGSADIEMKDSPRRDKGGLFVWNITTASDVVCDNG
jgi:hypothetical protein